MAATTAGTGRCPALPFLCTFGGFVNFSLYGTGAADRFAHGRRSASSSAPDVTPLPGSNYRNDWKIAVDLGSCLQRRVLPLILWRFNTVDAEADAGAARTASWMLANVR